MKEQKSLFIENSRQGRNNWYLPILLLIACLLFLLLINFSLNLYIIPIIRKIIPVDLYDNENFYSLVTGIVFWIFIIFLYVIYPKIYKRSFFTLINANGLNFRWSSFFQGLFIWGFLTFFYNIFTNKEGLDIFINQFNFNSFLIIIAINLIFCSSQTLLEELVFRGYLMQTIGRKIKKHIIVNIIISLLFGVIHIYFGLEAFISSFVFALVVNAIVLREEGIERAYGIHLANNFVFGSFFVNLDTYLEKEFSTHIDWFDLSLDITSLLILFFLSNILIKRNRH
ncbi:MAG: CPBP family intramembrane glutamic endopeptidase [Candidatus Kapaibacterium sp.]